jgi:hypothetical protein
MNDELESICKEFIPYLLAGIEGNYKNHSAES